jgi:hypothetical protein
MAGIDYSRRHLRTFPLRPPPSAWRLAHSARLFAQTKLVSWQLLRLLHCGFLLVILFHFPYLSLSQFCFELLWRLPNSQLLSDGVLFFGQLHFLCLVLVPC